MGKGKKRKIKQPKVDRGGMVKVPLIEIQHFDYPIFCFRNTHPQYNISQCDDDDKKALLEKIDQLSQMDWQSIEYSGRHGAGSEKINRKSLNVKPPPFITNEVEFLLSLRFNGLKPMLIHRNRFIMHVIFIDPNMSVYDH